MPPGRRGPPFAEPRVATPADLPALTETMARAFYDDPVWGWAYPDPDLRLEQHRLAWGFALEAALAHEWVWLTPAADGACAAGALWIPPGEPELRPEEEARLEALIRELLGAGAARVLDTFARFEAAHPEEPPHYYLSLLATHPEHRGGGLGMALLAANLERIDADGVAAFLESSNPANDHRYERLGFAPCGRFELGEGGPSVTQMWRSPS